MEAPGEPHDRDVSGEPRDRDVSGEPHDRDVSGEPHDAAGPPSPYDLESPPNPYDPDASTGPPVSHRIVVRPTARNVIAQNGVGIVLCAVGFSALVAALVGPETEHRTAALIGGSIFGLLGLVLILTVKRTLTPPVYLFSRDALEGTDAARRSFRLPWTDVESIAIEGWEPHSVWYRIFFRRYQNTTAASLRIAIRPDADLTGPLAAWSRSNAVRIPFWNRPELVDSFA